MFIDLIKQYIFNKSFNAWLLEKEPRFFYMNKHSMLNHSTRLIKWSKSNINNQEIMIGALARYIADLNSKTYKSVEDITFALIKSHTSGIVLAEYIRSINPLTFNIILMMLLNDKNIVENNIFNIIDSVTLNKWINTLFEHGILNTYLNSLNKITLLFRHRPLNDVLTFKWSNHTLLVRDQALVIRYIYNKENRTDIEKHWLSYSYTERVSLLDSRFMVLGVKIEDINPYTLALLIFPEHKEFVELAELTDSNPYKIIKTMLQFGAPIENETLPVLT